MKITHLETFNHVDFPNLIYVQVFTDSGIYGTGESYYFGKSIAAFIKEFVGPNLIGEDPLDVEEISRKLTPYVGALSSGIETRARSAIDIALWDIRGKVEGKPIYELLGGKLRSLPIYNTCAGRGYMRESDQSSGSWGISKLNDELEDLQAFLTDAGSLAKELVSEGIGGMKIWPLDRFAEKNDGKEISKEDLAKGLEPIRKIKAAVGNEIEIMLELHGLWSPTAARMIFEATKEFDLTWIEDPLYPDCLEEYETLRGNGFAPIAHGETLSSFSRVKHLLQNDLLDVLTLDLGWCGGYTNGIKLAELAKKFDKLIAPHDCTGPIGLIAGTHLSTAATNIKVQETVRASLRTWYPSIVSELPTVINGEITLNNMAGLGTDLSKEFKESPGLLHQNISN
jgi:galactonate dehydratase